MHPPLLQNRTLLLLLTIVTLAFGTILWPLNGAIFWGVVLAILFSPLHRRLQRRMPRRRNLAAFVTLCICLVIVILPMALIGLSLVQEASVAYERVRSGQLNYGAYLRQVLAALPAWVLDLLDRFHLTSMAELQARLTAFGAQASQFLATKALD
ncbi:MAG TPA: AI-2E family transporter, partial [Alicycliphilus sp.]|nr:AI-2E family transporter [Alicycliphilus sp.]